MLLPGIVVLVLLLLFEAVFRWYNFGVEALIHPSRYTPVSFLRSDMVVAHKDPKIRWRIRPDADGRLKGGRFTSNSSGLRNPPLSTRKPENTYRIALMGASVSMGAGVDDEMVYGHRLQEMLNRDFERPVQVLNFSVGAYTLGQILASYDEFVRPFEPDLILLPVAAPAFFGKTPLYPAPLSSAIPRWTELRSYLEYFFIHRVFRKAFSDFFKGHLSTDWRRLGRGFDQPRIQQETTGARKFVDSQKLLEAFVNDRAEENIPVVALLMLGLGEEGGSIAGTIAQVAAESFADKLDGLTLIDSLSKVRPSSDADVIYYGDSHPNGPAHSMIARAIYPELVPLLQRDLQNALGRDDHRNEAEQ